MANDSVILRFSDVSFSFEDKPILDEASFSVRNNSRIALMGQNGAGKSSLFKLITGELKPNSGHVFVTPKETTIATAKQVMSPEHLDLTVRDYFALPFREKRYDLDKLINDVLEAVNLHIPLDNKIRTF